MKAADLGSAVAETTVASALQVIATNLASGSTTVAVGPCPRKVAKLSRWAATVLMITIVGVTMTAFAIIHSSGLDYFADWCL